MTLTAALFGSPRADGTSAVNFNGEIHSEKVLGRWSVRIDEA